MKKKKRKRKFLKTFLILLFLVLLVLSAVKKLRQTEKIQELLQGLLGMEPQEVQQLRKQEISGGEPGKVEYYFSLLDEEEQRAALEVADLLHIRCTDKAVQIDVLVLDPADIFVWQLL